MNPARDATPDGVSVRHAPDAASILRPTLIAFGIVLLLFAAHEAIERTWLSAADVELIYTLHRFRGATAALIAGALASWLLVRRAPPLLARPEPRDGVTGGPIQADERRLHYARWFVLMRWIAVVVAAVLVVATVEIFGLLPRAAGPPLAGTIAMLAMANLFFSLHLRRGRATRRFLTVQVYVDVGLLVVLLHFSGGIENPLTPLALLHVIIAAIVLERRQTYLVAGVASGLFALLALGEWSGVLPHYDLGGFPHPLDGGTTAFDVAHDLLYVASRVAFQTGMLLLIAFFTTSMTDRIRSDERRLERFAHHSLAQARLLTRALEEQKIAEAARIRAERLAALGQMAGQIAHEVNNPIAILSAKARLLLRNDRDELTAKSATEVAKIIDLADRVARIAQGLLTFCRPATGPPDPVDVRLPIRTVLADLEARAEDVGVHIHDELPDDLPFVLANARELAQVFLNVFHNALDAMPRGGHLRIGSGATPLVLAGGSRGVEIVVEDTGTGIPPALRDRIFEPFLTTKSDGRGVGLGLSICLGLVRGMGGEIAVESEPGRYTRVFVRLPVASSASAPHHDGPAAPSPHGVGAHV